MLETSKWEDSLMDPDMEEPVLELSVSLPASPWEGRSGARLKAFYAQVERVWLQRWKTLLFPRASRALRDARDRSHPFSPWRAELTCHASYESDGLLSLYRDVTESNGISSFRTVRAADTWDLSTGSPLTLAGCLACPRRWRRTVLTELRHQVRECMERNGAAFYPDAERRASRLFSPERFYLTPEGITVFYPVHALGPRSDCFSTFLLSAQTAFLEKSAQ